MDHDDVDVSDGSTIGDDTITSAIEQLASFASLDITDDESIESITASTGGGVAEPRPTIPTTPSQEERMMEDPSFTTPIASNKGKKKRGKVYSIAHDYITTNNLVLFHVDIEIGGASCGIIQLATVAYDVATRQRIEPPFNRYVNPGEHAIWSTQATSVHGITAADERIKSAKGMHDVWSEWKSFIESNIPSGKKGAIVAWGGKSCDCEWLFKVTVDGFYGDGYVMPKDCPFFMDPKRVIEKHPSCQLHKSKSNVLGYGLAEVWCFVKDETKLGGAHNALADAVAQLQVVDDGRFWPFIDRKEGWEWLDQVWAAKRRKRIEQLEELSRKLPKGWDNGDKMGRT